MLRVVRFSKTIGKFLALPGAMKNDLIGFSITSFIAFMAFSSSGMVVFGTHMKAFSNVLHTNYALFDILLGRFVAEEILEANRYVGPVYFTLFMICIFIILVNFLVTIICDAIASDASIENDYDQELVDYIWKTFQQIFGIHLPSTQDVKAGEEILSDLDSNLRMIEESLDDTLDVACSICPDAEDTSDGTSFSRKDQRVALSLLSKKPSKDTYETANEAAPQASTSVMSLVYEEAQSVLRTHEDDAAKLNEVQNETRRRAQAIVQRKLAAKRRIKQARHGDQRLASIAESAEVLLEQHADDEERLERQYQNNRRQFENKLRQKLTARRKQKDKEKK
ncbi:uncharacterized protein LOC144875434 [Branchiostoma floridae x Branchiostoma japonicum]